MSARVVAFGGQRPSILLCLLAALWLGADVIAQVDDRQPKLVSYLAAPYTLRIVAGKTCDVRAHASLIRREPDGVPRVVWDALLMNNPMFAAVDPAHGWVVTMGNACSYALEHAVVIYDAAGAVVRDLEVSQIFTSEERLSIGFEEFIDAPRHLSADERTGNDLRRSSATIAFQADGIWLIHPRLGRRALLGR